jgi:hypothetical protein
MLLGAQTSSTPTFTTINLNNTVLQSGAKRLGMNLGAVNFYDSGQMMKNLIVTNPGFEGGISQSMIMCGSGTATSCTDSINYSGWPANYWTGAKYTVVYGTAIGRTGTISSFTPANNQNGNNVYAVFNFADSGPAPSNGDYMIVSKVMPGNAADGWNPKTGANGTVTTDTTDLPSDTQGTQAVALNAPAPGDFAGLTYYFDSTSGHTFLQLNGNYNLSFKAKAVSGSGILYVGLKRLTSPSLNYIYSVINLTNQWQTYNIPFSASETGQVSTVELDFATAAYGGSTVSNEIELDDASMVQLNTDPTNNTVFRDAVVNTLKQLKPGVLRFWFNQEGETLDNLLAPQLARQRGTYSAYVPDANNISYGLAEFLQLCQTVGAGNGSPIEPWIVLPVTLSDAEASSVIDYLAGSATGTIYGAKRAALGQTAPWTTVFPKIHLEFSNEAWNAGLYGGNMANGQAYGTRAQNVFTIMRNNANYNAAAFDLMINGQATNIGSELTIQAYCNNNDTFAAQPYMMLTVNDPTLAGLTGAAATENLFGSTFAEAEAFVTASGTAEGVNNGLVLQNLAVAQSSGRPVQFAVTETNIDPFNNGSISQAELDGYTTSIGGGLALIDSMLQNMRVGVLTQNIFALPGYQYFPSDGKSLFLYGSVVDMGVTNLKRPQFLAEQVANNAIGNNTTMLQTVHTGLDPTWNQAAANSVQLNNAHYLQSFAFNSGDNYSLIIFNTNRTASEQVNFAGANVPGGTVQMTQLTSTNITDTNETSSVVAPVSSTLSNFNAAGGMTLPPFSMTTLTWTAPAISNVTVTAVSGTSATVNWTNDDSTSSTSVIYGTTTAYGAQSAVIPAGGTQSVTLTGLTPGTTYDFAVMATSGTGATSTSGNFTFGTTASFTISAPSSISLAQGQSGSVPVLVTDGNGFTGSVQLSLGGLPSGATGTFQINSGGASLSLSVPSTVLAGTYSLTIAGTAGGTVVTAPLSLVVSGASQSQTITFNSIPNQYIGATVTPVATASSGLPVTFSLVQNGNCSISGGTVTFLNAGNCGIIASQAGNATYGPASVGQIVVVNSALPPQTITFNSIPDQTVGATVNLSATSSAGLTVTFTSSTTGVCTVSGSTATTIAIGTCTITASQAGTSKYAAAPNVPQSFNVTGKPQTITFATIPTQTASTQTATTTVALTANSTSGLTVTFTSSTQSICTVSGATATLTTTPGNCTITASQAGNSVYAAATPVPQTFTVNPAPLAQTITFGAIATQNVNTPLTLSATASSGLAVTYASSTTAVCTVSGSTASFIATGTCTITASQAGNSTYAAATPVSQSFTVAAALKSQTITFGAIAAQTVGTPLTLTASASSGLAVSFASNSTSICTVSGTSAQFIAPGTCSITATQPGGSGYAAATAVTQTFTVNAAAYSQTITFNSIATQTVGTPLMLTASATSNLAVSFASTTASVCTVSGSTATFIASGQCSITASQPGNNAYAAATPVTQSFTVNPGPQSISFGAIQAQAVGTPLTLTATASSGLAVTFASTTSSVCTVSGTTASFIAAGTCSITASQAGNGSYAAANPVTQSFAVLQGQTITFGAIAAQTAGTSLTLNATASSGLAVSYATSSASTVCTLSGSSVTFAGAGTCSITASQAGNSMYSAAAPVTQSITVNAAPKAQTITFGAISAQQVGTPLNLNASATSGLAVSFASNSTAVCTVSGTQATFVTSGTCSITASQAGNSSYTAATPVTQSFTVNGQGQIITFSAIPTQQAGTSLTLGATASSGLAVSYASATSSVCTVSGSTAALLAGGSCTITASQAGNSSYAAATPVSQTFTVQAASGATTTTTAVSLGSAANVYGIVNNGSSVPNSGLDTYGYAYSANLLGTNLTFQGVPYTFGTAGSANAASSNTIALPSGSYSTLNILGTGVNGNQTSQTFTVTYTDGTTTTFTQSLSDWGRPQSYTGETIASTMAYRLTPSGAQDTASQSTGSSWYLYFYSFALNNAKTVKSFTLPNSRNVAVVAVTLSATQAAQTITFGAIATQTVGTPLTLSATASSGLTVSYAASPSSVCSVTGTTASFAAAGTCTITASQAGNSSYAAAPAVSQSFTVQAASTSPTSSSPTTVSLGSAANVYGIFNNGSSVTNGGLDTSNYAYSANLLGTSLTLQGIPYSFGTPGAADAASSSTIALPAGSYSTLNFLGTAIYGNQPSQTFTVTYTDGTTSTFTQSLSDWGAPQSYTGETIASTMAYRLTPNGSQSSGASFNLYAYTFALNSAKTVQSFTLPNSRNVVVVAVTLSTQAAQTITFNALPSQIVGGTLTVSATASSGLPVTFSVVPNGNCSVSGNVVTFLNVGNCGVLANQAGNSSYLAAPQVGQIVVVNQATAQSITFGAIATQTVGTPLTLSATASSGLAVSYASSTTGVCTVSGSTATFVAAGTCSITASQAGNNVYSAAKPVTQSFSVNGALQSQTISFGTIATQTVGTPLTLSATASSGLAVSYASSATSICTVSGSTATFVAAGTCTITASQAGNGTYAAATSVSQSFTVNAQAQTITFGSIAAQTVGTPLTLNATASSGLAVSYASSTTSICTVSGSTATFVAAGTCTITASQAGNSAYAAATPVSQSFTVNAGAAKSQTITFGTIAAQTVGTPLTLTATASSSLAVSYSSSTTSICTVSGSTASFVASGTCTITASQAGNASYSAATPVSQSFTVNGQAQTITFNSIPAQTVGSTLTVSATASSGLPVTFSVVPNGNCSVSGNVVTFLNTGNCGVVANQAGNSAYAAAAAVGQIIVVNNPTPQTITFGSIATQTVGTPLTLTATASSGLAVSYASSTTSICTVSGATATFVASGNCTITASQAGNNTYSAASPVSQSFAVNAQAQTITFNPIPAQTVGSTLTVSATASSGLPVAFTVVPNGNCSISGSVVTFLNAGNCGVIATQSGNSAYAPAAAVGQIIVVNNR